MRLSTDGRVTFSERGVWTAKVSDRGVWIDRRDDDSVVALVIDGWDATIALTDERLAAGDPVGVMAAFVRDAGLRLVDGPDTDIVEFLNR